MRHQNYLLGSSISHSKSPEWYRREYQARGLSWTYDLHDEPDANAARAFLEARRFLSCNVTTPYKRLALDVADVVDYRVRIAGGANLLVNRGGELHATNTDGRGFVAFLKKIGVRVKHADAVVCGTGPTARAIAWELALQGANVTLLSRNRSRALAAVEEMERATEAAGLRDVMRTLHGVLHAECYGDAESAIREASLVVDATTLGMRAGDPAPFSTCLLRRGQTVVDTVYGHGTSALLHGARLQECAAFDGQGMLTAQAICSLEIVLADCDCVN